MKNDKEFMPWERYEGKSKAPIDGVVIRMPPAPEQPQPMDFNFTCEDEEQHPLVSDGELICPKCGFSGLHQKTVTVIGRRQEDGPSSAVSVEWDGAAQKVDAVPNGRRQSVEILFLGECGHQAILTFWQYKGRTMVDFVASDSEYGESWGPDDETCPL